ncbi:MAG: ribosome biogenesis GTPase YlqF [SAR324 cluster bacterium]|nr:ribosome biogenesis GTPase YlqF [SAR324 cluster bacterium]
MSGGYSKRRINWFPGHMAKALRDVRLKISKVDLVLEIRDARIPLASGNPSLEKTLNQKPRLIVFNKVNLAEQTNIRLWQNWFSERNERFLFMNAFDEKSLKILSKMARSIMQQKWQKFIKKGIHPPPLRMMLLGIPNTGKSTIINRLTKRKAAGTGDRPGVTRTQEWVVLGKDLELLDTPGIMPPRIDTEEQGLWLCAIHAIKDEIIGQEKVASFVVKHLQQSQSPEFMSRYQISELKTAMSEELILKIGAKLNFRKKGGEIDYVKSCARILKDFRSGLLGACSFEKPPRP